MVRGEIVRVATPRGARGHEQRGPRPAVVVQADELLGLSTVLVAPTSRSAAPATFRPLIDLAGTATCVLVDQLRALDAQAIGDSVGRLDAAELDALDHALELMLGLRL
ncbi:MAG TPA: type II toxin-antitoxin system PemK/MazF family toxin [Solirubrobacteraceae bacterium]|nr:type II toxin-antitoxin system PemK/MazF family toxin [Solirubrobacteraceae bacterium]